MVTGIYGMLATECQFLEVFIDMWYTCRSNQNCGLRALFSQTYNNTFGVTTVFLTMAEIYEANKKDGITSLGFFT